VSGRRLWWQGGNFAVKKKEAVLGRVKNNTDTTLGDPKYLSGESM